MKLRVNLQLFKEVFSALRRPSGLAYPSLLLLGGTLVFLLLHWFFFAPMINNALVDVLETGKTIQAAVTPTSLESVTAPPHVAAGLETAFRSALMDLVWALFWFILGVFALWCLLGSALYRWIGQQLSASSRKAKASMTTSASHEAPDFLLRFTLVSAIYTLYALIIALPAARISFFFPSSGQLLVLTSAAMLLLFGLHFQHISYTLVMKGHGPREAFFKSIRLGTFALPSYLFSYVLLGILIVALELLLRLLDSLIGFAYVAFGIIIIFPLMVCMVVYLTHVTSALLSDPDASTMQMTFSRASAAKKSKDSKMKSRTRAI